MRRHQVRHKVLPLAQPLVLARVPLAETLVHAALRLAHHGQHRVGHVLGRNLQLAAHMVLHQLAQKLVAMGAVGQHVIEADARAHEHLLHARKVPQTAQKGQVVAMVGHEARARLGREAALVAARAMLHLLGARGCAEVRRRASHIVKVAFEIRVGSQGPRFLHDRIVAARLHDAPLMERERAKRALAEAAPIARQAELDLLEGRHATCGLVARMVRPRIRQPVHRVHLGLRKRRGGRVLHDELVVGVRLHEALARERIAVGVLHGEAARIGEPVGRQLVERRQHHRVVDVLERARPVHGAVDEREVRDGQPRVQRVGDLHDGALTHAEAHEIGAGIQQDGALELVGPIVVMRKTPQARLDAAQHDGRLLEGAADEVGVHHGCVVRSQPRLAARRVRIGAAALPRHRVVVHHRVHVAGRDEKRQARFAELRNRRRIVPVGLRDHAHAVAVRL